MYYVPDGVYIFISFCRNEDGRMLTSEFASGPKSIQKAIWPLLSQSGGIFQFHCLTEAVVTCHLQLRFARRGPGSQEGSGK